MGKPEEAGNRKKSGNVHPAHAIFLPEFARGSPLAKTDVFGYFAKIRLIARAV